MANAVPAGSQSLDRPELPPKSKDEPTVPSTPAPITRPESYETKIIPKDYNAKVAEQLEREIETRRDADGKRHRTKPVKVELHPTNPETIVVDY